jgi:hypothetical protein
MHLNKLLDVIITISILSSFLFTNFTIGEEIIDNKVNASFDIEFVSGTYLNVYITMDAIKLTTDKTYDSEEIKTASDQEMGALKFQLYLMLDEQLKGFFKNADILNFSMPVFDNGLFYENINVELTSSFFNLNESVDSNNLINGILDMGAIVNYSFNLLTKPGWDNRYTFILPNTIEYTRTTGSVRENRIHWDVKNGDGQHPDVLAEISIKLPYPTTPKLERSDIKLEFILDHTDKDNSILITNILTRDIDISDYDFLPDFIDELNVVPSDGLRLFIANGLTSWNEFYNKTIKIIEEKILFTIEKSSFNQTLDSLFSWDDNTTIFCQTPYEKTNMDNDPPIIASLIDNHIV